MNWAAGSAVHAGLGKEGKGWRNHRVWGRLVFFFPSPPGGSSKRRCSLGSPGQTGATQSEEHERRCTPCPLAGGKSRWVCGWAQGVDSGREILSVRASPRLCQSPGKLPAEEEAAAAAARVPLRARPAPRCAPAAPPSPLPLMLPEDGSGLHISKLPPGEGKRERKKRKKRRKERKKGAGREGGGGGVH